MERITKIKIKGEEYTLALTLPVMEAITEKVGGIEKVFELFKGDLTAIYKNTLWLTARLLEGGRKYMQLTEEKEEKAWTEESLGILFAPYDMPELKISCLMAVSLGMNRTVETEVEKNV